MVLLLLFSIFINHNIFGQKIANSYARVVVEIIKEKKSKKVEPKILVRSFVTGDSSFVKTIERQIRESIQITQSLKRGKYIVGANFIIAKDGTYSDVSCVIDPGFGLCQELTRIIKKSPRWLPAKQYSNIIED